MILRCTGKLLRLLGVSATSLATAEPSDQDWYANLLWLEHRKCLLLVHAGTLFSAFAADIRKADLVPMGAAVVNLIQRELRSEGLPKETFGSVHPDSVTLARTASRVILGYMNEMAHYLEYALAATGGLLRSDAQGLNLELRRELHMSRQPPGYIVPIELARSCAANPERTHTEPRLTIVR